MSPTRCLLFITPVMPAATGNGLAMRAGMFLDAFARAHEVSLLVVPVAGPADSGDVPDFVSRRVARVVVLNPQEWVDPWFGLITRVVDAAERAAALKTYPLPILSRMVTPAAVRAAAGQFADVAFDIVHVFRVYLAPFAGPFLEAERRPDGPACVLDVDDDESRTHRRLADLYTLRGDEHGAREEASEAAKYERLEQRYLSRFDRVLVCARRDRDELRRRLDADAIDVVPNAVRIPETLDRCRARDATFTILFVGSLGYFPNADGIRFFCDEVLPALRGLTDRPVRVEIVGADPSPAVLALSAMPEVTVAGRVPSVEPWYRSADAVVVPLRAGGGTRIKTLEAFAHGVPVVSTALGAEGLDAEPERHLLVAEDADGLARACLRLMREPELAAALAARARGLVVARYALPSVTADIGRLYETL